MISKLSQTFFLLIHLLVNPFACQKSNVSKSFNFYDKSEVSFCDLVDNPQSYQSKIIRTKAIVLGYHTFIFYNAQCLEQEKVIALEMSNKSRQKIGEAIFSSKVEYKKDFLKNNLYAEVTVLGELSENTEENKLEVYRPKNKFVIKEIKEINILSEEIYPNEKARGLKKK